MDIKSSFNKTEEIKRRYFPRGVAITVAPPKHLHIEGMRKLIELVDASVPPHFSSHRKILGPIIIFLKNRVIDLIWPFIRIGLRRQSLMNHYTWGIAVYSIELQQQIDELRAEIQQLKGSQK